MKTMFFKCWQKCAAFYFNLDSNPNRSTVRNLQRGQISCYFNNKKMAQISSIYFPVEQPDTGGRSHASQGFEVIYKKK